MTPRRAPHPWVFALAAMPYGAFNGVVAVALPYLLRQHGVSVDRISSIAAVVQAPTIWYVLWSPIVDLTFRRRTWIVLLAVTSGACVAAGLGFGSASALRTLTVLLVAASALSQPISSAVGGLVASVMPNEMRGRAGGWTEAGILGGGVFAGGIAVWLAAGAHYLWTAIAIGALVAAPSFVVLRIAEPLSERPSRLAHLARMWREIVSTLRRRDVWLAFAFFLSPVSAGALMNLFSAVAVDFHASSNVVIWTLGLGGVMITIGAVAGGMALDHMNRWWAYPLAGLLSAVATGSMLLAPVSPATYIAGAAAYALVTGFGYAAFMTLALQLLGTEMEASGTRFTLFMAAVNVPVVYMVRLDGLAHAHFGVRGLLATDGLANAGIGAALAVVLLVARGRRGMRASVEARPFSRGASPSEAPRSADR